jgi:nitrate reductase (cytochrome), electron transfer subunit
MTRYERRETGLVQRVVLIGAVALLMAAGAMTLAEAVSVRTFAAADAAPVTIGAAATPIEAEAGVFRTTRAALDDGPVRRVAHPRTLAAFRARRAYPGAPPRIPHGLTADEFRTGACRTCHERGGYSQRFGAYAPVTPHPELADCLQCHTGDDVVIGAWPLDPSPDGVCRQCHDPGADRREPVVDWRPAAWPTLAGSANGPPPIPHDAHFRGNCVACHAGPGAVTEIRTTHAEHADCRQCHLQAGHDVDEFTRPVSLQFRENNDES